VYSVNVGGRAFAANIYFVAIQQLPFQAGHAFVMLIRVFKFKL